MTVSLASNIMVPGGYGGPDPGIQGGPTGPNPYPVGQCTYGVWKYVYEHFGVKMPDLPGNATDWYHDAQQQGWEVTTSPTVDTAIAWSSNKYPPYGHVAWVTSIQNAPVTGVPGIHSIEALPTPANFTVYEWNFTNDLQPDSRTIKIGSKEAEGIEGYIKVPGVKSGDSLIPGLSTPSNPWTEFAAGLQSSEQQLQQDVTGFVNKAIAGGQIVLGGLVIAGGTYMLVKGQLPSLPSPGAAPAASSKPGRALPGPIPAPARATAPAPAPAPAAPRTATPERALRKVLAGRFADLTPAEVGWVQSNPMAVKEAMRSAGRAA